MSWTRIPADIPRESDRRTVLAILGDNELEVRVAKDKCGGTKYKFFVEYRERERNREQITSE